MDKVSIKRELLVQMLSEAYMAGWHGSLEGKATAIEEIVKKHTPKKVVKKSDLDSLIDVFGANHPIFSTPQF